MTRDLIDFLWLATATAVFCLLLALISPTPGA